MKGYFNSTTTFTSFKNNLFPSYPTSPSSYTASKFSPSFLSKRQNLKVQNFKPHLVCTSLSSQQSSSASTAQAEEQEVEIANGYTMTQFCDKIIDLFLNEKTKSKEWRGYLIFREEWKKYKDRFYSRCQRRADLENDPIMKEKFISLQRKVKKVVSMFFVPHNHAPFQC